MLRRKRDIIITVILIAIAAMLIPIYINQQRHTTFRAEVIEHFGMLDRFKRLEIRQISKTGNEADEERVIEDAEEIRKLLNDYKDHELKRADRPSLSAEASPYYYEWRLLIIKEGRESSGFNITFYDKQHIEIFDASATRDALTSYKVDEPMNWFRMEQYFKD